MEGDQLIVADSVAVVLAEVAVVMAVALEAAKEAMVLREKTSASMRREGQVGMSAVRKCAFAVKKWVIVVAWKMIETFNVEDCCYNEEGGSGCKDGSSINEEEGCDIMGGGFAEESMHPPFCPAMCEVEQVLEQISYFPGSQLVQGHFSLMHMYT